MILFMDGFDHCNGLMYKWNSVSASTLYQTPGRFGVGGCMNVQNSTITKVLPGNYATLYAGRCRYSDNNAGAANQEILLGFSDSGTSQCDVRIGINGTVYVTRNGTVLATSAIGVITPISSIWQHIGFKATIHPTAGAYDVWVDGVNVLSGTGVNTRATANSSANTVFLQSASGINARLDDFYVGDTSGSAPNNDFLGDVRVSTLYPTGAGNHTDFTHSTGTTNWGVVDETPPNTTDYNSGGTVGNMDTFSHGSLPTTAGAVYAVQSCVYAMRDDAGARSLAPMFRQGTTDAVGADKILLASYVYGLEVFNANPAAGATPWVASDVNAMEFGYKVTV